MQLFMLAQNARNLSVYSPQLSTLRCRTLLSPSQVGTWGTEQFAGGCGLSTAVGAVSVDILDRLLWSCIHCWG